MGGEPVTGTVVVRSEQGVTCKRLDVACVWTTHGSGNIARGEADGKTLFEGPWEAGQEYRYPFELNSASCSSVAPNNQAVMERALTRLKCNENTSSTRWTLERNDSIVKRDSARALGTRLTTRKTFCNTRTNASLGMGIAPV